MGFTVLLNALRSEGGSSILGNKKTQSHGHCWERLQHFTVAYLDVRLSRRRFNPLLAAFLTAVSVWIYARAEFIHMTDMQQEIKIPVMSEFIPAELTVFSHVRSNLIPDSVSCDPFTSPRSPHRTSLSSSSFSGLSSTTSRWRIKFSTDRSATYC